MRNLPSVCDLGTVPDTAHVGESTKRLTYAQVGNITMLLPGKFLCESIQSE